MAIFHRNPGQKLGFTSSAAVGSLSDLRFWFRDRAMTIFHRNPGQKLGFTPSAAVDLCSAPTSGSCSGSVRWPFFTVIQAKNWVSHRLPRSARVPP